MLMFVGASLDPDHSPGDPEQREHEHLAWISEQGLHHQAAGKSITILQSLQFPTCAIVRI